MPSLTVVVSSDTDICFSPGLYGDCLPTVATGGAADSFRAERLRLTPSCSHMVFRAAPGRGVREFVTSTLWPSSN
ncbi:hypothetical protein CP975_09505 [Streptomyces alboniger]|uniref:Uncharacterized protein n=1 Tax=Streptomyces alboniger TaxID=132473 RepID=A0A5J6HEP8_STRAD|nr:hypothetical protein CP975_09505 [Streptomyces alboniger]